MKKNLILLIAFFAFTCTVFANYVEKLPVTETQPDGTVLHLFVTGDEFYKRVYDADGYTLLKNPKGWVVYATLDHDKLVATEYIYGQIDPKSVGLVANIDISTDQKLELRNNALKNAPQTEPTRSATVRTGTFNNIVVFITFPTADLLDVETFTYTMAEIEELFNGTTPGSSLFSYYRDISGDEFHVETTFFPTSTDPTKEPYVAPLPRAAYTDENPWQGPALLTDALESVQDDIAAMFPGGVDNICYIIQGEPEYWNYFLWSAGGPYMKIMEGDLNRGTLVHEMYHCLGAPDLYVYPPDAPPTPIVPVGSWDPMAAQTAPPQSSLAYITDVSGNFISDAQIEEITGTGTYTLYDSWDRDEDRTVVYTIPSPTSTENEFFVLEYRRKSGGTLSAVYESGTPNEGIVITRINPNVNGNANSDGTYANPFGVYVYRQGGTYYNNGNLNNACFKSDGLTSFSDISLPTAFLSNNLPGLGGIVIDNFSAAGGEYMTFGVTFPDNEPWKIGKPNPEDVLAELIGGVLIIYGEGDMMDWENGSLPPWYDVRDQITKVDIQTLGDPLREVKNIGNAAFYGCSNLTTVNIASSVLTIGDLAFALCTKLPSITIPDKVTTIGHGAFFSCSNLTVVNIGPGSQITSIGQQAFMLCTKLQSFTIPNGVTTIQQQTFAYSGLTSISIPCNVTTIESDAFNGCTALAEVWICKSVTDIGTDLISFVFKDCTGLTDIWVEWQSPPDIIATTFGGVVIADVNLHIPCQYYDNYINAPIWKGFNIVGEDQTITVSASPPTYGTVTGGGDYPCGKTITVTATPEPGRTFLYWREGSTIVSYNANYTFVVKGERNLVAYFGIASHTINLQSNPVGAGTLTGAGTYSYEAYITVKATFNSECYTFINWTEGGTEVSVSPEYSFFVYGPRTLTANFEPIPHEIILYASPSIGGTVSGGGTHNCGTEITVTATPNTGYEFVNWTEGDIGEVSTDANYTFTVALPRVLTANFQLKTYKIDLFSNPSTGGTTAGGGIYTHGDKATMSATPNDCYEFLEWTDKNGIYVTDDNPYSFFVTKPDTLIAVFALKTCAITVETDPPALGAVTGGGNYICGASVTVVTGPINCYKFTGWTKNDVLVSTNFSYQFEVTEDYCPCTLVANFEIIKYDVSIIATDPTEGTAAITSPNSSGTYDCGESITVEATPTTCYKFVEWRDENDKFVSTANPLTFIINKDTTLVAIFEIIKYDVIIAANPIEGSVTGDGTYDCDDEVTVEATPTTCYDFVEWRDGNNNFVSTANPLTFFIDQDTTLVAVFVIKEYDVIIIAANPIEGSVTGDGTYDCGDEVTVEATPTTCYSFVEWQDGNGNFVSTANPLVFYIDQDTTLVAIFEIIEYDVITMANPVEGTAAITSPNSSGTYDCDDEITVEATPTICYDFVEWQDGNGNFVSDDNPFTFVIDQDTTLVAVFIIKEYDVIIIAANPIEGSVTGDGTYDCGDEVTVEATPTICYSFVEWQDGNGNFVSTANPLVFYIDQDTTLVAIFEIIKYDVITIADPIEGSVTGADTYDCGDEVTVEATATICYDFVEWRDDNNDFVSTDNPLVFFIDQDTTLVAVFEIKTYTVAVSATTGGNATITSPNSSGTYDCGEEITVEAEAQNYYYFLEWQDNNGNFVSAANPLTFILDQDTALVAIFTLIAYDIIVIPSPAVGDNDATGGGTYPHGTPVIVTATADTCYIFVNWTKDGEVVSNSPVYLFIAVEPCTLIANFIPKQYIILTEEDPDEGGETYGGGLHDCGTDVTVTAVPAYGYNFVDWTEDGIWVSGDDEYTFIAAEHRILTAHFEPKLYDIELLVNPPLPLVAGDVFGAGSYPYGENITVSAVAETCYFFVNWTEDNVEVSKNADYTFTVTKDRILVANFDRLSYDVIVLPNPTGGGTVDGGGSHLCGDTIPIWAVPNDCYDFVDWTENGVSLSTDPYYDFIVTGHHVL
ncbi:MAG: leucine-rich repeat protein, partial [Bacteroidales bacterium]|nr:leucine-rich repeat protein [Bacteroidales bacterium]